MFDNFLLETFPSNGHDLLDCALLLVKLKIADVETVRALVTRAKDTVHLFESSRIYSSLLYAFYKLNYRDDLLLRGIEFEVNSLQLVQLTSPRFPLTKTYASPELSRSKVKMLDAVAHRN